jgi:ATP-dependent helicase/nuclease subunit B
VERRIGLSAHDFAQAMGAPTVYLTRATRVEGAPTVPSRWLRRLDAFLQALGLTGGDLDDTPRWMAMTGLLDQPERVRPTAPPAPTPPIDARPKRLSVTRIETWMRDPYALYAREILRLKRLDPLDADPGAADRGLLIHAALERFVKAYPDVLPEDAATELTRFGEAVFAPMRARPGVYAFWMPRFRRIVGWVIEQETRRRADGRHLHAEVRGSLEVGDLTLVAVADRIETLPDGRRAVLDYKTGQPPSGKDVALGFAPQLPLEAAMVRAGAFDGVTPGEVAELTFWRLSGGEPPGEEKTLRTPSPDTLAHEALAGLEALIARFADPRTAYHALPRPDRAPAYNDYAHLARVKEWATGADDAGEG